MNDNMPADFKVAMERQQRRFAVSLALLCLSSGTLGGLVAWLIQRIVA